MEKIIKKYFSSEEDLLKYSKKLEGHSLREIVDEADYENAYYGGKGSLGQNVEKLFFGYTPNSIQEPDFDSLERELKVAPLKKISKKTNSENLRLQKGLAAKERIVLTIIDYCKLAEESWENNSMKDKIRLLLMFYLHESEKKNIDLKFELIDFWEPSKEDMKIIREDWKTIQEKVLVGQAHYISEGDTLYLGACTKGSTTEKSYRKQPMNKELAKQRAFSLKSSYVNSILEELLTRKENLNKKKIIFNVMSELDEDLETAIRKKFEPFIENSVANISSQLKISLSSAKNFYSILINKILVNSENAIISELEKAGIKLKVIRVNNKGQIAEDISFPTFDFIRLSEEIWDESELRTMLEESKYLFVVLQMKVSNSEFKKLDLPYKMENIFLKKIIIWNMPIKDIDGPVKKMWQKTKDIIINGIEINMRGSRRYNNFPGSSEGLIMHVRPHGQNSKDLLPLPNGGSFTKQSFWFNRKYIEEVVLKK